MPTILAIELPRVWPLHCYIFSKWRISACYILWELYYINSGWPETVLLVHCVHCFYWLQIVSPHNNPWSLDKLPSHFLIRLCVCSLFCALSFWQILDLSPTLQFPRDNSNIYFLCGTWSWSFSHGLNLHCSASSNAPLPHFNFFLPCSTHTLDLLIKSHDHSFLPPPLTPFHWHTCRLVSFPPALLLSKPLLSAFLRNRSWKDPKLLRSTTQTPHQ